MSTTPNMNLLLPDPTITPGPTYASENDTAFYVVDAHDHTLGKGVPIPANGLNINNDLPYNGFNALTLRSTQFQNQGSPLSLPGDLNNLYVSQGNLYYNNQIGQQVQITSGASLNASSIGGIGGDYVGSGALEFYTSATKTFTFWSSNNVPANLDAGSITIREVVTSPNGITISSPTSLVANYGLVLPTGLPVATGFLTVDPSGNMSLATPLVGGLTQVNMGSVGQQVSSSSGMIDYNSGTFTPVNNLSVTITTTGRPVMLAVQSDGQNGVPVYINLHYISVGDGGNMALFRGVTQITSNIFLPPTNLSNNGNVFFPLPGFLALDRPTAGTYTYTYQASVSNTAASIGVYNAVLVAYEL